MERNPLHHLSLVLVLVIVVILYPSPPQDELEKEVEGSKSVTLELVFGYHWKPATGESVRFYSTTHKHLLRPHVPPPSDAAREGS